MVVSGSYIFLSKEDGQGLGEERNTVILIVVSPWFRERRTILNEASRRLNSTVASLDLVSRKRSVVLVPGDDRGMRVV